MKYRDFCRQLIYSFELCAATSWVREKGLSYRDLEEIRTRGIEYYSLNSSGLCILWEWLPGCTDRVFQKSGKI